MQTTEMQGSTHGTTDKPAQQASAALDRLGDTAQHTYERVSDAASKAASRIADRGSELLESPTVQNARAYVREHPMAAIGIAIAAGLLISRLTSRR